MKILTRKKLQTKEINIYGTDGKLHTEDFFEKYFSDTSGAYPTLPNYETGGRPCMLYRLNKTE